MSNPAVPPKPQQPAAAPAQPAAPAAAAPRPAAVATAPAPAPAPQAGAAKPAGAPAPAAPAARPNLTVVPGGAGKPAAPVAAKPGAPAAAAAAPAAPIGPVVRRLKRGETLFAEGEMSRAMYLIKSGKIRIFKKKGDSSIEIDTVHSGQVLGELAFLDGNPRSASGEALTECELTEISGPTFQAVLDKMPEWLKILLKTVVGRLRTASTRIRQLEQASTALDYSDKDGKRSSQYVFFSAIDTLKILSGILLVASRNKEAVAPIDLKIGQLTRYINQIMGVPVAKMTTMAEVLASVGLMTVKDEQMTLNDPIFLEQLISFLNEENLLEPSKRHDISLKAFMVMSLMVKHMAKFPPDPKTGLTKINIAEVKNIEAQNAGGKEPFRLDDFPELVKLGYATNLTIKSQSEAFTDVKADEFVFSCKIHRVQMAINAANEQKRVGGKTS